MDDKYAREEEKKAKEKETALRAKAEALLNQVEDADRFRRHRRRQEVCLTVEEEKAATDIYNDLIRKTEEAITNEEEAEAVANAWTREVTKVTSVLLSRAKNRLKVLQWIEESQ